MERDRAISIVIDVIIKHMPKEMRQDLLLSWWGIDQEDEAFHHLPRNLQDEILRFDEPQEDVMDESYNPLLNEALRNKYLGVRNEYLSHCVSDILQSDHEVVGEVEELHRCPCCEYKTLQTRGGYDICPVCFWEDDGNTAPNRYSSPNHMTLAQGQEHFMKYGAVDESSLRFLTSDRLEMFHK